MGHYCHICHRVRANEKFSGRGHRNHVCKDCQRMPSEKRDRSERLDEVWGFLEQNNISPKNITRLESLLSHADAKVQTLAALVLDSARAHPYKRRRWRQLAARDKDLFQRAVAVLGIEFFEDVLLDYGDTDGPLWDALEQKGVMQM